MWVPKIIRERRKRLADMASDTAARTRHADKAVAQAKTQSARSAVIAQRSAELAEANNIAAILAGSLRIEGTANGRER